MLRFFMYMGKVTATRKALAWHIWPAERMFETTVLKYFGNFNDVSQISNKKPFFCFKSSQHSHIKEVR